jgi:ribosome-binding protein aMBF1 (putative translation factor)
VPKTRVVFYQDADGRSPVVAWLARLREMDLAAYTKCAAAIERLAESGYELRRPTADMLRDGIRELRIRRGHVNYWLLYFFHGRSVAILTHALTKEGAVPAADLERALQRKAAFANHPLRHTYSEWVMNRSDKPRRVASATAILGRLSGSDRAIRRAIDAQKLNTRIAEMILHAREREGLTQAQLAARAGTTQSVISRLEDADYDGHSLSMLRRIATALHRRVELRLVRDGSGASAKTNGSGAAQRGRTSRRA